MVIKTDSFYKGTHIHPICQDFATHSSSVDDSRHGSFLGDGCSSSPLSEIGSRLVTLKASKVWKETEVFDDDSAYDVIDSLYCFVKNDLNISSQSLDTTLLSMTYPNKRNNFDWLDICCWGDGVVALQYEDYFTLMEINYESEKNYPNYLSYRVDEERRKDFWKLVGRNAIVLKTTIYDYKNQQIESSSTDLLTKSEYFEECCNVQTSKLKSASIFSDGVSSFERPGTKDAYPVLEVVKQLIDFNNTNGVFVQRAINKITRSLAKEGYVNHDDLSMATFYFDHTTSE